LGSAKPGSLTRYGVRGPAGPGRGASPGRPGIVRGAVLMNDELATFIEVPPLTACWEGRQKRDGSGDPRADGVPQERPLLFFADLTDELDAFCQRHRLHDFAEKALRYLFSIGVISLGNARRSTFGPRKASGPERGRAGSAPNSSVGKAQPRASASVSTVAGGRQAIFWSHRNLRPRRPFPSTSCPSFGLATSQGGVLCFANLLSP
jgi:hypothetical protein